MRCPLLPLVLACALAAPAAAGEARVAFGSYTLRGPLESFVLDGGRAGSTTVELELGAGETLAVELAVPVLTAPRPGFPAPAPPEGSLAAAAEVRFTGWEGPRATRMRELTGRVPLGLTARTRPPVAERRPGPAGFELAVLVAAGLLGLGLRRRPLAALAVGAVAAAALVVRGPGRVEPTTLVVLEGHAGGAWIEVTGSWGAARLDGAAAGARLLRVETTPPDAPLRLSVDLTRTGGGELATADAALFVLREPRVSGSSLPVEEASSAVGIWYRSSRGAWTPAPGHRLQGDPPGWLASGLPQGVGVLLHQGTGGRFQRQTGLDAAPDWAVE